MTETDRLRPTVLVFHKILDDITYSVSNYRPSRLARLLTVLRSCGWHFDHPVEQAEGSVQGRGLAASFDDGYQHLGDVLPGLMEACGVVPIVFVPAGLIGRPNRWDYNHRLRPVNHLDRQSIRQLANLGVAFGSHGLSHCDLTGCKPPELEKELVASRAILQDLTGQEITALSYPFGRCDERVIDAAAEAGYRHGFTMAFPAPDDRPLTRGRVPVYGFDTAWSVCCKLKPGPLRRLERAKAATVNRLSSGTVWLNRLRGSLKH